MASPGWFPDPGGIPGLFRYWDGSAWTGITTKDPAVPLPGRPGPPQQPGTGRPRKGRQRFFLIGLVLLLILVASGVYFAVRTPNRSPLGSQPSSTVSAWDDSKISPSPTASPSPPPPTSAGPSTSAPTPVDRVACDLARPNELPDPPADDLVHGGPLSFAELPRGWSEPQSSARFPFSRDSHVQTQPLPEDLPWQASAQVGVAAFDDYPGRKAAAQALLQCLMTSNFYTSVDVTLDRNDASEIKINKTPANRVDALLTFSHPRLKTKGSEIRIIVVDSDPVTYYFHAVPMERDDLIAELDTATDSLQVE